jgi:transposase InsO family protein
MKIRMKNLERPTKSRRDGGVRPVQPEGDFVPRRSSSHLWFRGGAAKAPAVAALEPGPTRRGPRFLTKVSGLSRAQITRLIAAWIKTPRARRRPAQRPSFPRRYSHADVVLLAEVDAAHEELSGPATRRILEREFKFFGKPECQALSGISVSHIYNLRHGQTYRRCRVRVRHTQRSQVSIAERRKPDPQGKPGYLRVDTVHQGQHDGQPGLYHLNAIDTVTQREIVGCVETISEGHLLPVLEAMLHQFSFRLLGFHCDNGSEFINHQVAALLNKLLVEFTKSRAYRTTDNALVEGKNGAVVR